MSSRAPDEFRPGARPYGRRPGAGDEPEDPHDLLHRARRLTAEGHPAAGGAWERAAAALRRAGGTITPGDHADALDSTALDCRGRARPAASPLFSRAADLHERSGQRGKALVSRARAVLAGPAPGATGCAELAELSERAVVLHRTGQATAAQTARVLLLRARALADLLDTAPDPVAEAAVLRAELAGLIAFAAPHRADPAVICPLAGARALLGRITAPDDPAAALVHLRAAVADQRAGGRPWGAVRHELLLAGVLRSVGAHREAAGLLRSALRAGGPAAPVRGGDRARLCLALARTLAERAGGTGRGPGGRAVGDEEVSLLAEAVRHAGGAAEDPRLGALARLWLGSAYAERGRCREAAGLLEESSAAFSGSGDDAALVRARAWLAHCALCLGEPGRAAQEYTRAAARCERWRDRRHAAALVHRAAHALAVAGSPERSARAYERAADLWRAAGDHGAVARALRARARQASAVLEESAEEVVVDSVMGVGVDVDSIVEETHREPGPVDGRQEGRGRGRAAGGGDKGDGDADGGARDADAKARGAGGEAGPPRPGPDEAGPDDAGPWPELYGLPEPYGLPGRYQVNVYGDVGGTGPQAVAAPRTRVQGCV
ncbi:hypothetical protein ACFVZH_13105 [Streptomyces sp. NPDC059534]|uniref:hypothetical protein n=1 Tax=Streptomyces sp. NPDC059534 TaxID=3346859 RepID=UPI0036C612CF